MAGGTLGTTGPPVVAGEFPEVPGAVEPVVCGVVVGVPVEPVVCGPSVGVVEGGTVPGGVEAGGFVTGGVELGGVV